MDRKGSHTLESVLQLSDNATFGQIFEKAMKGTLARTCKDPIGNFVVQSLISNARTKDQIEAIYDEIAPEMTIQLLHKCPGVFVKITEAAKKFLVRQDEILKMLVELLSIQEYPNEMFSSILQLTKAEFVKEASPLANVNLHGSLILQHLLEFNQKAPAMLVARYLICRNVYLFNSL